MEESPKEKTQPDKPVHKRKFPLGGVIVLVVGVILLLQNMGVEWADNIWFPAILIVLGLGIIFKK